MSLSLYCAMMHKFADFAQNYQIYTQKQEKKWLFTTNKIYNTFLFGREGIFLSFMRNILKSEVLTAQVKDWAVQLLYKNAVYGTNQCVIIQNVTVQYTTIFLCLKLHRSVQNCTTFYNTAQLCPKLHNFVKRKQNNYQHNSAAK